MTCYHPIKACYSKSDYARTGQKHLHILLQSDTKEASIINSNNYPRSLYEYINIPCRKCAGCASDKAKEWSLRAQNEMSLHNDNCFITLTYDNTSELVKSDPLCICSLRYKHFQLFMKRLRKMFPKDKIGYMVCGEYGHKDGRAHWHAILFGFDFPDKVPVYVSQGYCHYKSDILNQLWSTSYFDESGSRVYSQIGYTDLANCDIDCCNYVSQYVLKKLPIGEKGVQFEYFKDDGSVYYAEYSDRVPPFVKTSRNPAIGLNWYKQYGEQSVRNGFVSLLSKDRSYVKKVKTPAYYNRKFEQFFPDDWKSIKDNKTEVMRQYYIKNPVDKDKLSTWEKSHLYRIVKKVKDCLTKIKT